MSLKRQIEEELRDMSSLPLFGATSKALYQQQRGRYKALRWVLDLMSASLRETAPVRKEESAWLVELGCEPTLWWTGRQNDWTPHIDGTVVGGRAGADSAIRFARKEDADRAIHWLSPKDTRWGCKSTEHIWLSAIASSPAPPETQP